MLVALYLIEFSKFFANIYKATTNVTIKIRASSTSERVAQNKTLLQTHASAQREGCFVQSIPREAMREATREAKMRIENVTLSFSWTSIASASCKLSKDGRFHVLDGDLGINRRCGSLRHALPDLCLEIRRQV